MRKMILCALAVIGFMNLSFGQFNGNSERISVKTYDSKGLLDNYYLKGNEALSFDVSAFIKENEDLERVVINGTIKTALLTTNIKFDSDQEMNLEGDYVCEKVTTKLTPFLGLWGTNAAGKMNGVDIKQIIPETSADRAGIDESENIVAFDGELIGNFLELKKTVLSREIGDRVEVTLLRDSEEYSKSVILGSRGVKTIQYKYCVQEPLEVEERNLNVSTGDATFTTFPNPTMSLSYVSYVSASMDDVIFSVTDIKGALLHKESFSNFNGNLKFDYDLGNQIAGMYIFSIQQGKEMYNRQVQLVK